MGDKKRNLDYALQEWAKFQGWDPTKYIGEIYGWNPNRITEGDSSSIPASFGDHLPHHHISAPPLEGAPKQRKRPYRDPYPGKPV